MEIIIKLNGGDLNKASKFYTRYDEKTIYTLFDKAVFHLESRQQEIDEVTLDERIEEYCKKDTK